MYIASTILAKIKSKLISSYIRQLSGLLKHFVEIDHGQRTEFTMFKQLVVFCSPTRQHKFDKSESKLTRFIHGESLNLSWLVEAFGGN